MKRLLSVRKQADGFLKKYILTYDLGNGQTYDWEMVSPREITKAEDLVHGPNAVELIAHFPNGDLLMQREFRYPANRFCYSFPVGMIDPGETTEEAARRELYEETGVHALTIDRILPPGLFAAGLTDELTQVVHMTVDGELLAHPEDTEEIIPVRLSREEVRALLREEALSITHSALLVLDTWINGI